MNQRGREGREGRKREGFFWGGFFFLAEIEGYCRERMD
jgi:hypothetical protein